MLTKESPIARSYSENHKRLLEIVDEMTILQHGASQGQCRCPRELVNRV